LVTCVIRSASAAELNVCDSGILFLLSSFLYPGKALSRDDFPA